MSNDYLPSKPYYVLDANERAGLEAEKAAIVRRQVDPDGSWVDRVRDEARLTEIDRLLKTDEFAKRQGQQPVQYSGQRGGERAVHQSAQREVQQTAEATHSIVCAKGYRAITEHPPDAEHPTGSGAILIIEDKKK